MPSPRTLCFLPTFVLLFQRAAIMGQLSLNAERVPLAKLALTPVLAQTPSGNGRVNGPGPGLGPVVKSESLARHRKLCLRWPCLMCT